MMPNLDPATRARLADALEGATPEMLREWAADALERASFNEVDSDGRALLPDTTNRGLAALALAVAEMQEGSGCAIWEPTGYRLEQGYHILRRIDFRGPFGDSLPAALAALLRTSEGA